MGLDYGRESDTEGRKGNEDTYSPKNNKWMRDEAILRKFIYCSEMVAREWYGGGNNGTDEYGIIPMEVCAQVARRNEYNQDLS